MLLRARARTVAARSSPGARRPDYPASQSNWSTGTDLGSAYRPRPPIRSSLTYMTAKFMVLC
jgi:hypothetical protein